jgi:hypothetical protein
VDRKTRQQLKHDEFKDSLVNAEEFIKAHAREIINYTVIVVVVVGLAVGLKHYTDGQEARANADLGEALATFRAYVGQPTPGQPDMSGATFTTAQEKYKKALGQFDAIVNKYTMIPRPKAVAIARYQAGVCQSLLDDHAGAVQTLTEASSAHDPEIASLAKMALAGEMVRTGKTAEAVKLYQELADHPTLNVPQASALLAMADAYRATQPAKAREIYQRVAKDFAADPTVAQAVQQQLASLTP